MSEYVQQRLREVGAMPAAKLIQRKPRQAKPVDSVTLVGRKANAYVRNVRSRSPERSTWFDVSHAFVAGWHSGQGNMLSTLRISGPTSSLIEILRRQANGLEAEGLRKSAFLMREAADTLENERRS
jgi:hypothetical protein